MSDGSEHSPFTKSLPDAQEREVLDLNDSDVFVAFHELTSYVRSKVKKAAARRQRALSILSAMMTAILCFGILTKPWWLGVFEITLYQISE